MAAELLGATGVAGRPPAQVRRALANCEVQPFNKRRVQGLGILRLQQRVLQAAHRTDLHAPLDPDDAIVPPSLEHLTLNARGTKEAHDRSEVVLEAIRGDQWESDKAPAEDDVVEYSLGVSIGAAADETTRPQARTHLDGRKEPRGPALAVDEGIELISLKLNDFEVLQRAPVEALCRYRGPLEPACDGVAGTTRETGRGRQAHALDSQARHLVELRASAAKTAVRCPGIRAGRCPAYLATVPASSTRLGGKPAVATDVDAPLSKVLAPWIGACLVLDRPHRSSVPGRQFRCISHDLLCLRETDQLRTAQAPASDLLHNYDVSPDGQRFLMIQRDEKTARPRFHVVLNWFDDLKRLVTAE